MRPIIAIRPDQVCPNCFLTWQAAKPRPAAIHCPHGRIVAIRTEATWRTEPATDSLLKRLRAESAP